jgi:hypothetical protein
VKTLVLCELKFELKAEMGLMGRFEIGSFVDVFQLSSPRNRTPNPIGKREPRIAKIKKVRPAKFERYHMPIDWIPASAGMT